MKTMLNTNNSELNDILYTVLYAAEQFFKGADIARSLKIFLPRLGKATNVDCAYIFMVLNEDIIGVSHGQRLEWIRDTDHDRVQGFSLGEFGDKNINQLKNAKSIICFYSSADLTQKKFLEAYSITSTLVIPLMVGNNFLGVIGFEFNTDEHEWEDQVIEACEGCANILGSAIKNEINARTLRRNEEQYRAVVEDQTELICRWNTNNKIVFVNRAFLRYFGLEDISKAIDVDYRVFFHINLGQETEFTDNLKKLTRENPSATITFQLDEQRWLQMTVRAIFVNALINEYQSVSRDMTPLISAEKAVKTSENKYQLLFNAMIDGFLLVSVKQDTKEILYVDANKALREIFGLESQIDIRNKPIKLFFPEMEIKWKSAIIDVNQHKVAKRLEDTLDKGYYELIIYPSSSDQVAILISDRTDKRNYEERIENSNHQLSELLNKLEVRNKQITLINAMSEMLLSCQTMEEAFSIVSNFVSQIFAGCSGSLYLNEENNNVMSIAAEWGRDEHENYVSYENCWALRRGQIYIASKRQGFGMVCNHNKDLVSNNERLWTICCPMNAQGILSGLFSLVCSENDESDELTELARTVTEQISMGLANIRLRESLKNLSVRDSLSHLFNRRYMEESLIREISQARRRSNPVSVIMCDIDHFKRINDEYGHDAGDQVIRSFADLIMSSIRRGDIPCRYGGEEFLIILPGATTDIAKSRAEAIRHSFSEIVIHCNGRTLSNITASFGVASYPTHADECDLLIKKSYEGLYHSKQTGRNKVTIFAEGMES